MDTELAEGERRLAGKLSQFGQTVTRERGDSDGPLVLSTKTLLFTNYSPGASVVRTLQVTNPGRSTRLVRVLPPARPFFLADV